MAAIFRVKRRNDDEPLDALVVACKKRKTESDEGTSMIPLSTIVQFAGTVKDQDENALQHITKTLSKEELKTHFKQHFVDITGKVRKETKKASAQNRFKVLNYSRSLDDSKIDDPDMEEVTVIDVEDTTSCKTTHNESENKQEGYVYDLYYTTEQPHDFNCDEFVLETMYDFENKFISDSHREKGMGNSDDDESDNNSNSESHDQTQYPEDPPSDHSDDSILDEDMREAVERLKIRGEESDLSSDDSDHSYRDSFEKFKARVFPEWGENDSNSGRDESSETEELSPLEDPLED